MSARGKKGRNKMVELLICLGVGLAIGAIFGGLKLPLPVPHGWGGVIGLVGMFVGGQIAEMLIR
jgi:XapX domain-containing protein